MLASNKTDASAEREKEVYLTVTHMEVAFHSVKCILSQKVFLVRPSHRLDPSTVHTALHRGKQVPGILRYAQK